MQAVGESAVSFGMASRMPCQARRGRLALLLTVSFDISSSGIVLGPPAPPPPPPLPPGPANNTDCAGHREYSDEQDRTKSLPSWGFYSHQGEVNQQRSQYVKQEFLTAVHAMKNVEQAEVISIVL